MNNDWKYDLDNYILQNKFYIFLRKIPLFLFQACADSITSKAKRNQQNRRYLSPFAKNAYAQGVNFMGGKEDDTTLLLASVTLIPDGEKTQEKDEL